MQTDQEHLIGWLAGRDTKCPVCEYNLRNLAGSRCPECNAELTLGVSSPNLNMAPWFVAVVSIALGAGFDGVVSVIMLSIAALVDAPKTPAEKRMAAFMIGSFLMLTAVCVTALVVGYRSRRRWAFWSRRRQWITAAAVFLATLLGHAAFAGGVIWRFH